MFPKIKNHAIERKGIRLVGECVEERFRWIFREQPICDTGIDAQVEIVIDEEVTGQLLAIRIKSGSSNFEHRTKDGYTFYGELRHLEYWTKHSLPVILVLCDVEEEQCYWQHVTNKTIEKTEKAWKIKVPKNQILDENSKSHFQKIASNGRFLEGNPPTWAMGKEGLDCWYLKIYFLSNGLQSSMDTIYLFPVLILVGKRFASMSNKRS